VPSAPARRFGVGLDADGAVRTEIKRAVLATEWDTALTLNSDQEAEMDGMLNDYDNEENSSTESEVNHSQGTADTEDLLNQFL
jgi:hypothetical protein